MKALVTGGGGFLGRYIVEGLLARGDEVTSFSRGAHPELVEIGAAQARGDLGDAREVLDACAGMDAVFHVAAKTVAHWGTRDAFYQTNVVGTHNVIAACRTQAVPKLVYTSTPSVVFGNRPHENADESLPCPERYEDPYSETKAEAERAVLSANGNGLLTVALRPHLIFGPRDTNLLPGVLARARTGRLPQVGDGRNMTDLTYVEDAARAHLLAADALEEGSSVAGSVYFISQDDPVNVWDWIRNLLHELGLPSTRGRVPLWAARAAGGALELAYRALPLPGDPFITRFLASQVAMSHYYDISRAKGELGYRPQFTMEEALDRTVKFLKGQTL